MTELLSKIINPELALVDFIGAILVLYWGHELFWRWSLNFSKTSTRFWGFLFLFSGLGALLYVIIHSFQAMIPEKIIADLNVGLLFLFVTSTTLLFLTGIKSFIHPRFQRAMIAFAILIYIIFVFIILNRFGFDGYTNYYYLSVLVFVLFSNFSKYLKYRRTSNKFAFFGLATQLTAIILLYNAVLSSQLYFHLLIVLSFYLLYVGARFSKDHVGE